MKFRKLLLSPFLFTVIVIAMGVFLLTSYPGFRDKDWTLPELQTFLEKDNTDAQTVLMVNQTGATTSGACEHLAWQLRDRAWKEGKHLSVVLLSRDEVKRWYGIDNQFEYHAVCMAVVGDKFYYIEPDTDKVWEVARID